MSAPGMLLIRRVLHQYTRLQNLKTNLKKKRSQGEVVEASAEQDASAKLVVPLPCFGVGGSSDADGDADLADLASKPKRRSVSVDLYGTHAEQLLLGASDRRGSVDVRASVDIVASSHRRASVERRASLEQWHEARRQRWVAEPLFGRLCRAHPTGMHLESACQRRGGELAGSPSATVD